MYTLKKKIKKNLKITLILCILAGISIFFLYNKKGRGNYHLAVIPHFMIMPERVDSFYAFLKKQYYPNGKTPDTIILLSPNHFFPKQKKVEGLCRTESIKFRNQTLTGSALQDPRIECKGNGFYFRGEQKYTKDHGLGEHFFRITTYFPKVKKTILLLLPSHKTKHANRISEKIKKLPGTTLVIASVDFSHYLPENIALKNDQTSFCLLGSKGKAIQLRDLDVDCPACLAVPYLLAEESGLQIQQRQRDSSSSIVGEDLKSENTSRQFLWWQ